MTLGEFWKKSGNTVLVCAGAAHFVNLFGFGWVSSSILGIAGASLLGWVNIDWLSVLAWAKDKFNSVFH